MPGKILGIDITEDAVSAVQVISGLKGAQIISCCHVPVEPDGGLDRALEVLARQVDVRGDSCHVSIPGDSVSYRNLHLPFRESKKIRQTLPFEIETTVPFPIGNLLVDFTITDQSDTTNILAVSVKKSVIASYLDLLEGRGISPDTIDIRSIPMVSWLLSQEYVPDNGLYLEIGIEKNNMVLFHHKRIALMRSINYNNCGHGHTISDNPKEDAPRSLSSEHVDACMRYLCTDVQRTIHSFTTYKHPDISVEKVFFAGSGAANSAVEKHLRDELHTTAQHVSIISDSRVRMEKEVSTIWNPALMDNALALALRDSKKQIGFNLRRDEFAVKKQYVGVKKELRKVSLFVGILILMLAFDVGVDFYYLNKRHKMLDHKSIEIFRQSFPDEKTIVNPVGQARTKVNDIKKRAVYLPGTQSDQKILDILRDISKRIPKGLDVHFMSTTIDAETVRIGGETDSFLTVDKVKSGLEASPFFRLVTISSANLKKDGKGVQFELKLDREK